MSSRTYPQVYQGLPERLTAQYAQLNFDFHCYLRIALDQVMQAKWDTVLQKPAYKHLSEEQLERVLSLLRQYSKDESLLLAHNKNSLAYRKKTKF